MKKKLISVLEKMGFDMSSWSESEDDQQLSEDHVNSIEAMQKENEQFKTDNAQLKTDLQEQKTAGGKAIADLEVQNQLLNSINDTIKAALKDMAIDTEEGMIAMDSVEKLIKIAKAAPGDVHSKTKSKGDQFNEEQNEIDQFEHNKTADESLEGLPSKSTSSD